MIFSSGSVYEVYDSLDSLIEKLGREKFFKSCRSEIINKDYIRQIDKANRRIILTNGYVGKFSRMNASRLLKGASDNEG